MVLQRGDGNSGRLRKALQRAERVLAKNAAAGEQDGALGLRDLLGRAVQLAHRAGGTRRGPVGLGGERLGFDLLQKNIARDVEMNRAERLCQRDAERAPDCLLYFRRRRNRVSPLGDRPVHRHLVDVLACVFLPHPQLLRAADADVGT